MYPNYIIYLHPLTINTSINDGISINQQWAPTPFNPFNLPHHGATPENWCASQAWRWTSPLKDTVVEALRSKVTPANAGEALGKPWKRDCHQIFLWWLARTTVPCTWSLSDVNSKPHFMCHILQGLTLGSPLHQHQSWPSHFFVQTPITNWSLLLDTTVCKSYRLYPPSSSSIFPAKWPLKGMANPR